MFNYQQVMELLEKQVDGNSDFLYALSRWEGPTATVIREMSVEPVLRPSATFFVYQDGRCWPE